MPNARIAQVGQKGVNCPFFEIEVQGRKFIAAVNESGKVEIKNPRFLRDLGVFTDVANQYQSVANLDIVQALKLDSSYTTNFDKRFPYIAMGTGLSFVADFKVHRGWANLTGPVSSLQLSY